MKLIILLGLIVSTFGQFDPNFQENRNVIVHLFNWKWLDIAAECERFLGPNGFGGLQISPPNEHTIIWTDNGKNRPWWERYQPISYKLISRSGNENEFKEMTRRCNAVGVRIYVDLIINHMSATEGVGSGGSEASVANLVYPSVPYSKGDFNPKCNINNWGELKEIRNCWLSGLPDLNQGIEHVKVKIVEFMNRLIDLGVAGFRVDATKHMWSEDLTVMYGRLKSLNTNYGFKQGARPFIMQEVADEGEIRYEYKHLGIITEFSWARELGRAFRGHAQLSQLRVIDRERRMLPSELALSFVDNHDSQRSAGLPSTTYKEPKIYTLATAFNIAFNYGVPRIMSSFDFHSHDQGPPMDANENLLSPIFNADGTCKREIGWICEHRWSAITRMISWRNAVRGADVQNWWDNGNNKMGFGRGNRGFILFNVDWGDLNETLQTGLPGGQYCDVVSGFKSGSSCTGKTIKVESDGRASLHLSSNDQNGFIAIHIDAKL